MVQTPHLPHITAGIRFALCCVRSPLLTASRLISFPRVTKTFQFTRLLVQTFTSGPNAKSHSDIFGSNSTSESPKLFAGCHVLHQLTEPSLPPNGVGTFYIRSTYDDLIEHDM
jgi:hypothetical protein